MNNKLRFIVLLGSVIFLAILSCYVGSRFFSKDLKSHDAHQWIHEQLNITKEQEKALESTEKKYADRKKDLTEVLHLGNMDLGQAIIEDKTYSPRVAAALEKIQKAQGELQKATLEHVFEMQEALTPEQFTKLLNLTSNALYASPHSSTHTH